jgi:hypothetical protein
MRHAIGLTLAASVSAVALGAVAIPQAQAADLATPDYGYQQPPQGYYPPQQGYYPPQQSEAYPEPAPPPVAYGYPPPPPPPVAYYAYPPAPVVVGSYPYYGRGPYWRGYGPRVAYGYGHWGHYRHW